MGASAFPLGFTANAARALGQASPGPVQIIDVREPRELAICSVAGAGHIPLRSIPAQLTALPRNRHLVVLYQVGQRSRAVTGFPRAQGFPAVCTIAGVIAVWAGERDPAMARYSATRSSGCRAA